VPSAVFLGSFFLFVKSCYSCQIMLFMSNLVIHVKSCYSCQILSFISQFMSLIFNKKNDAQLSHCHAVAVTLSNMSNFVFVSSHVSWVSLCTVGCLIGPYFNKVRCGGVGGSKGAFEAFGGQLCCRPKAKTMIKSKYKLFLTVLTVFS
jgi:hypothetical protein